MVDRCMRGGALISRAVMDKVYRTPAFTSRQLLQNRMDIHGVDDAYRFPVMGLGLDYWY